MDFVVIFGNLASGFDFYGPFHDAMSAETYARENCNSEEEWLVCPLLTPEEGLGTDELLNTGHF